MKFGPLGDLVGIRRQSVHDDLFTRSPMSSSYKKPRALRNWPGRAGRRRSAARRVVVSRRGAKMRARETGMDPRPPSAVSHTAERAPVIIFKRVDQHARTMAGRPVWPPHTIAIPPFPWMVWPVNRAPLPGRRGNTAAARRPRSDAACRSRPRPARGRGSPPRAVAKDPRGHRRLDQPWRDSSSRDAATRRPLPERGDLVIPIMPALAAVVHAGPIAGDAEPPKRDAMMRPFAPAHHAAHGRAGEAKPGRQTTAMNSSRIVLEPHNRQSRVSPAFVVQGCRRRA